MRLDQLSSRSWSLNMARLLKSLSSFKIKMIKILEKSMPPTRIPPSSRKISLQRKWRTWILSTTLKWKASSSSSNSERWPVRAILWTSKSTRFRALSPWFRMNWVKPSVMRRISQTFLKRNKKWSLKERGWQKRMIKKVIGDIKEQCKALEVNLNEIESM